MCEHAEAHTAAPQRADYDNNDKDKDDKDEKDEKTNCHFPRQSE